MLKVRRVRACSDEPSRRGLCVSRVAEHVSMSTMFTFGHETTVPPAESQSQEETSQNEGSTSRIMLQASRGWRTTRFAGVPHATVPLARLTGSATV